jgi:inorganic phosphate transporter, PiT family
MALAWLLTIPLAALAAAAVFGVTQLSSHVLAGVLLAVLGAGLAVALLMALRRTTRSAHLEPDQPQPALVS